MRQIDKCLEQIQEKEQLECFPELLDIFKPLIYSWLKRIHQLHTTETDDYLSIAKILLLECAKDYDTKRQVPFESYYKIRLYHWYGNHMQKKKIPCVSLSEIETGVHDPDMLHKLERENKILLLNQHMDKLNHQEQDILKLLLKGQKAEDVAKHFQLSKKTILNKKYIIIKKLKTALAEEHT